MKILIFLAILVEIARTGNSLVISEDTDLNISSLDHSPYEFIEEIDRINTEEDENEDLLGYEESSKLLIFDNISPATLAKICQNFELQVYLSQDDLTIDCRNYQENGGIVKRDVFDQLEEGSGEPDDVLESHHHHHHHDHAAVDETERDASDSEKAEINDTQDETDLNQLGLNTEETNENKTEEVAEEQPEQEGSVSEDKTQEQSNPEEPEPQTGRKDEQENSNDDENQSDKKSPSVDEGFESGTQYTLEIKPPGETDNDKLSEPEPQVPEPEVPEQPEPELKVPEQSETEGKVPVPDDVPTVPKSIDNPPKGEENPLVDAAASNSPKLQEVETGENPADHDHHHHSDTSNSQSQNESPALNPPIGQPPSVLDNSGFQAKADDVNKKGKSLAGIEKTASDHHSDEEPAQHESTENTKKASKDTTILIFLFVAVVIVGALAFAYNFIKKRKRQSADLERVERGPTAAIKRSLQSLTKAENEQEMKPLINENLPKEQEMVELKKKENGNVTESDKDGEQSAKT